MDHERNAHMYDAQRNSSAAVGLIAKDPEVESPSRIRDGLSTGEERLSDVHTAIDALERRLDTVLSPIAPNPTRTDNGAGTNAIGAHVTGRITLLNEGFAHAIQRLRDLTRRIEV